MSNKVKLKELVEQYGEYYVRDELISLLEKPKPKTVWELQYGDEYFVVCKNGKVTTRYWKGSQYEIDCRLQGYMFITEDDALYEAKCREVKAKVSKYARSFIVGECNWYAMYDFDNKKIIFTYDSYIKKDCLYFESYEKTKQAINEVGYNAFVKYFLGVRDYDENK